MEADSSIILIKIGGSTLGSEDTSFGDVAALQRQGARPVIVHGGGPAITSWMAKLGIHAEFVRGLRVTDGPSLESGDGGARGPHQQATRVGDAERWSERRWRLRRRRWPAARAHHGPGTGVRGG